MGGGERIYCKNCKQRLSTTQLLVKRQPDEAALDYRRYYQRSIINMRALLSWLSWYCGTPRSVQIHIESSSEVKMEKWKYWKFFCCRRCTDSWISMFPTLLPTLVKYTEQKYNVLWNALKDEKQRYVKIKMKYSNTDTRLKRFYKPPDFPLFPQSEPCPLFFFFSKGGKFSSPPSCLHHFFFFFYQTVCFRLRPKGQLWSFSFKASLTPALWPKANNKALNSPLK